MIDFSILKGLKTPKGNVTKITDINGNVLWEAPPSGATVTITKRLAGVEDMRGGGYVTIDGVTYNEPTNIVVPLGTVIVCKAPWASTQYGAFGGEIKLNGTVVAFRGSANPATYDYTVNKDAEIAIQNVGSPGGVQANISITEL